MMSVVFVVPIVLMVLLCDFVCGSHRALDGNDYWGIDEAFGALAYEKPRVVMMLKMTYARRRPARGYAKISIWHVGHVLTIVGHCEVSCLLRIYGYQRYATAKTKYCIEPCLLHGYSLVLKSANMDPLCWSANKDPCIKIQQQGSLCCSANRNPCVESQQPRTKQKGKDRLARLISRIAVKQLFVLSQRNFCWDGNLTNTPCLYHSHIYIYINIYPYPVIRGGGRFCGPLWQPYSSTTPPCGTEDNGKEKGEKEA